MIHKIYDNKLLILLLLFNIVIFLFLLILKEVYSYYNLHVVLVTKHIVQYRIHVTVVSDDHLIMPLGFMLRHHYGPVYCLQCTLPIFLKVDFIL